MKRKQLITMIALLVVTLAGYLIFTPGDESASSESVGVGDEPLAGLEIGRIAAIVITTTDDKGQLTDRMLARFNSTDGKIYVSAHHWPRGWYKEAIKNPNVKGTIDGEVKDYLAVPVEGDEFEMVARGFPLRLPVKIMMGFPPKRQILRLDPLEN